MSLRIANREFAPRLWAALLTVAVLAVAVALGWWQVGRAREKQAMVESFQRGTKSSVELRGDVTVDELPRYQHVRPKAITSRRARSCSTTCLRRRACPGFAC